MKIWDYASYYLNYFNFMRGDSKIVKYFEEEKNKAIKELTEEGYLELYKQFKNLIKTYSNSTPLNQDENNFIDEIFTNCLTNSRKTHIPIYEYKQNIKMTILNLDKDYKIKFLENEIANLKDNIKNIFSETVILRFIKKLLEIFIVKNINYIEIENYIPDKNILENYDKSLEKNYVYRNGFNDDIQKSIKNLIEQNKELENKKIEKNKKQIFISSSDKTINEIIKIMLKMKSECNKIIHGKTNEIQSYEKEEKKENPIQNEIKQNNNINDIKKEKKYIKVSKIINFIINRNNQNQKLKKLNEIKKQINDIIKNMKDDFENFTNYKIEMENLIEEITKTLVNFPLKEFTLNLSNKQLKILSENLLNNLLNFEELVIKDRYNGIEKDIKYINEQRELMDIKNKIKLNITFYNNVNLIYIKKRANELLEKLKVIVTIDKQIENINKSFNENLYNSIIKLIDRDELIGDKKQQIKDMFEKQFKDESIDINNGEINNFYFFTFLLKKNLYDETSYKNSEYLNENYI